MSSGRSSGAHRREKSLYCVIIPRAPITFTETRTFFMVERLRTIPMSARKRCAMTITVINAKLFSLWMRGRETGFAGMETEIELND